jgi:hypothetical protein
MTSKHRISRNWLHGSSSREGVNESEEARVVVGVQDQEATVPFFLDQIAFFSLELVISLEVVRPGMISWR